MSQSPQTPPFDTRIDLAFVRKRNLENWIFMNRKLARYLLGNAPCTVAELSRRNFGSGRPLTKLVERGIKDGALKRDPTYWCILLTDEGKEAYFREDDSE